MVTLHESDHFISDDGLWRAVADFTVTQIVERDSFTTQARFQFFYDGRPFETRAAVVIFRVNPDRTISITPINENAC